MEEEKLVLEAVRRGLITPEVARDRITFLRNDKGQNTPPVPGKADSNSPPPDGSMVERFAKGAFEGVGQAGLGIGQAAVKMFTPATFATGVRDTLEQPLTSAVDRSRARVNDLGTAGTVGQVVGNVAGSLPFTGLGAVEAAPAATTVASRIAGSALMGGIEGAKQAVGSKDSRLANATIGAATGGIAQGIGEAAKATNNAIIPTVQDTTAKLAQRAKDLGIPVSVQNLSPTKTRNTLQKVSQAVPFSGVQKFEDTQRSAWNKAIAKTLGEDADSLGPETIRNFLDKTSKGYDQVLKGKEVQVGPLNLETLDTLVDNAKGAISNDLVGIIQKNVDDLKANIGADGVISGEKLASFRSQLLKRIPRAEAGAKEYLGDVAEVIDDLLDTSLDDASKQSLGQLRRQWRNYRTLEPLLEKATTGEVNPTLLLNRVAASPYTKASRIKTGEDELVDLARIGKEFLPKLSGSDTFEKTALTGGLGGTAGTAIYLEPTSAVYLGSGIATNRAFQKLYNQNPYFVNKILEKNLGDAGKEAQMLLSKGAPLDIVAKAISNSGAGKQEVKNALEELGGVIKSVKNNIPSDGKKLNIPVTPKNYDPKTGKIKP